MHIWRAAFAEGIWAAVGPAGDDGGASGPPQHLYTAPWSGVLLTLRNATLIKPGSQISCSSELLEPSADLLLKVVPTAIHVLHIELRFLEQATLQKCANDKHWLHHEALRTTQPCQHLCCRDRLRFLPPRTPHPDHVAMRIKLGFQRFDRPGDALRVQTSFSPGTDQSRPSPVPEELPLWKPSPPALLSRASAQPPRGRPLCATTENDPKSAEHVQRNPHHHHEQLTRTEDEVPLAPAHPRSDSRCVATCCTPLVCRAPGRLGAAEATDTGWRIRRRDCGRWPDHHNSSCKVLSESR